MFFYKSKELENRVAALEEQVVLLSKITDELINLWAENDTDVKLLMTDYLLHKAQSYHVIKDEEGKFKPTRLEMSTEKEFLLMEVKAKLERGNNLGSSSEGL